MATNNEKTPISELTAMKTKIDAARVEKAKLEGQLADRMARLKALGFDTVEAAEAHLDGLHEQIAGLDDIVRRGVAELKEKYSL